MSGPGTVPGRQEEEDEEGQRAEVRLPVPSLKANTVYWPKA